MLAFFGILDFVQFATSEFLGGGYQAGMNSLGAALPKGDLANCTN